MKRFLLIVCLLVPFAAGGCVSQNTAPPTTQPVGVDPIAIAADQVTVAVTALNIVRASTDASGKPIISDEDWANLFLPAIHIVQNTLLAWQSSPAGSTNAQKAESAFLASLPEVLKLASNAQHKAHPNIPTTKPVQ